MLVLRVLSLIALIFQVSWAFADLQLKSIETLKPCWTSLQPETDTQIYSFRERQRQWVKYEDGEISLNVEINSPTKVIFKKENKLFEVVDAKQAEELMQFFYLNLSYESMQVISKIFKDKKVGIAYRVARSGDDANIYAEGMTMKEKILQLPKLPPFEVVQLNGIDYLEIPHPDIFNYYLGYDFFVTYLEDKKTGIFEGELYSRIISTGHFPIMIADGTSYTHDIIGHGLIMAIMHDQNAWLKTVEYTSKAYNLIDTLHLTFAKREQRDAIVAIAQKLKHVIGVVIAPWEWHTNGNFRKVTREGIPTTIKIIEDEMVDPLKRAKRLLEEVDAELVKLKKESN